MLMKQDASIFIGYRRHDSQGFAGRVADDLIDKFGTSQIFRDDDIPEGSDFTRVLEQALGNCGVLIAVIGPNWLKSVDDNGLPRLHHPDDWVRREIEIAFDRGIWVLPVLVGNAAMPSSGDLPESLIPMTNVQAIEMTDRHWEYDLERLITLLTRRIPALNSVNYPIHSTSQAQTPALTLRDTLEKIAQTITQKHTANRAQPRGFARVIGRLFIRILWFSVALLVAWYVFDNHTSAQFRQNVFEFLAFAQDKATRLIAWIREA